MANMLDLDQLKTFVAIAETGSFTRAAEVGLQDPVGRVHADAPAGGADRQADLRPRRPGFQADRGRRETARLCPPDGAAFRRDGGGLRRDRAVGQRPPRPPDDYADRFLPEVLARFSRSNPRVEVAVICEPSTELLKVGPERRRRSRHRHLLRRGAGRGHPAGAAALGRFGAAWRRGGGDPAARALQAALHLAERGARRADQRRAEIPRPLPERQFGRDRGGDAGRPRGDGARRIGAPPRHARAGRGGRLPAPAELRDRHHRARGTGRARRSSTSSPSTSSPRSTTFRSRRWPPRGCAPHPRSGEEPSQPPMPPPSWRHVHFPGSAGRSGRGASSLHTPCGRGHASGGSG